jgi:hypothetical protein
LNAEHFFSCGVILGSRVRVLVIEPTGEVCLSVARLSVLSCFGGCPVNLGCVAWGVWIHATGCKQSLILLWDF